MKLSCFIQWGVIFHNNKAVSLLRTKTRGSGKGTSIREVTKRPTVTLEEEERLTADIRDVTVHQNTSEWTQIPEKKTHKRIYQVSKYFLKT